MVKHYRAIFRCDASPEIGTGHVMRCLTLAKHLDHNGWECSFLCAEGSQDAVPALSQSSFPVNLPGAQPNKTDWMIIDHYDLDYTYEAKSREWAKKILVIDDLANRSHDCDILLDQTYGSAYLDYKSLVPERCKLLTGSQYALLRPQFAAMRQKARQRRQEKAGRVDSILVSMGGTNIDDITTTVLQALSEIKDKHLIIDVVLGEAACNTDKVKKEAGRIQASSLHTVLLHNNISNMADLMVNSDLSIGAGGTTSWERCCLGLPTIMIEVADNQHKIAVQLDNVGAAINLGPHKSLTKDKLSRVIKDMLDVPEKVLGLANASFNVSLGRGLDYLLPHLFEEKIGKNIVALRFAEPSDACMLFNWQKIPETRKYFRNPEPPSWEDHFKWLEESLSNHCRFNYIICFNGLSVGVIALDKFNLSSTSKKNHYEISILLHPEFKGKGIAKAAINLIKKMMPTSAFSAEIYPENQPSCKLFQQAGFKKHDKTWYRFGFEEI